MISVRPATYSDILSVAERLRPEDYAECRAGSGLDPQQALVLGAWASLGGGMVVLEDKLPIAIFGLVPGIDPVVGHPWLLGTPELTRHPREFVRRGREWFRQWHLNYQVLTNVADARNTSHLRWLKACGAEFTAVIEAYGPERRPFVLFEV